MHTKIYTNSLLTVTVNSVTLSTETKILFDFLI